MPKLREGGVMNDFYAPIDERKESHRMLREIPESRAENSHRDEPGLRVVEDWNADDSWWEKLPYGIQLYEHERYQEELVMENMTPTKMAMIEERRMSQKMYENRWYAEQKMHQVFEEESYIER